MSEPKQYNISSLHPYIIEDKNGFMIYYEDYAELKAENARLQAEVERLRKAGDELERVLTSRSGSYEAGNASHEWQSAKNYKPSV